MNVTLILFNRPGPTARVLARVRDARPSTLLVICDGPRPHRPDDAGRVAAVRRLVDESIDWPCRVLRDYSETNLGCMRRIQTGLNWVFSQVEETIVLEDDCLPHPDFFTFAASTLARYRDDPRVMNISGTNLIARRHRPRHACWFSQHTWIWGWATWRRAWRHYDADYSTWDARLPALRASFASAWERQYWISTFDQARRNLQAANSWGFQWNYTCRSLGGLTAMPRANLVENLGFTADSTHTDDLARLARPTSALGPLSYPESHYTDPYAEDLWTRVYAGAPTTPLANLKSRLRILRNPKPAVA
ncbi:hypothetical protein OH491_21560 [Termitidicoccus mucosus]|uniref:Hemolytic protein HlpA-like protein n=1 Tax=Termitidicoccus mucosus TaxID=1184151 RepID=A0A178IEM9_9BACT|nr:hypothetical protein AW736_22145 [Opitutaceae bacterium TSB47]